MISPFMEIHSINAFTI